MVLCINSKNQKLVAVYLKKDGKIVKNLSRKNEYGSQVLLPLISKLVDRQKVKFRDLTAIEVETGPGSFTGIRVGVSVANALAYSLGIPVNGKKLETELFYS